MNSLSFYLDVDLTGPLDLPALVERVQAARGRPLRIVELPQLAETKELSGLWMARDSEDIILHASSDSELHRDQFVLHMILGHDEIARPVEGTSFPGADEGSPVRTLCSISRDDQHEIAAELLADKLAGEIRQGARRRSSFLAIFGR